MVRCTQESPYAERAREQKALELEEIALAMGVTADELVEDDVRRRLLRELSRRRGHAMSASLKTWRKVWALLHDRETSLARAVR